MHSVLIIRQSNNSVAGITSSRMSNTLPRRAFPLNKFPLLLITIQAFSRRLNERSNITSQRVSKTCWDFPHALILMLNTMPFLRHGHSIFVAGSNPICCLQSINSVSSSDYSTSDKIQLIDFFPWDQSSHLKERFSSSESSTTFPCYEISRVVSVGWVESSQREIFVERIVDHFSMLWDKSSCLRRMSRVISERDFRRANRRPLFHAMR